MTDSGSVNQDEREDGSEIIERKLSVMSDFVNYDVDKVDNLEYTAGESGEESGEEIIEIESGEDVAGEESGEVVAGEKSYEDVAGEESGEDVVGEKSCEGLAGEESGEEISSNIILGYEEDSGGEETYEEMQILISPKKKLKPKKKARSSSEEKKAEGQEPKTKAESSPKKKTEKAPRKKKAESPAHKKKAESPARKKKAEVPARKKKAESPARKKKVSPAHKKQAESAARKKKAESFPPKKAQSPPRIKKTDSSPPKTKAAVTSPIKKDKRPSPKKRLLSPPPKEKKSPARVKKAVLSTTPKKEILKLKQGKKKKGGLRKKKGTKKKAAGVSKQDKEKKYVAEEHEVDYVRQDQPTEEGVEQLLEAIRKEAEYDPAAAARERERREDQLQEIKSILESFDVMVQREKLKDWENEQWEGYLRGCGKANPLITCEANGYITTWQDLTEDEDAMSILRESHSCLELVKELELAIEESPDKTHEKKAAWMMTYKNLHELLQDKLDKATYILLKCAANYFDPDTYNMRLVTSDVRAIHEISAEKIDEAEVLLLENNASILLCLWANLVRNPRFKGPTFSQIGHSIELPRSTLLTECALRILHTSFDPYSQYQLNEKQKTLDQTTTEKQKESDEENSEICTDTTAASIAITPTSQQTESVAPTIRSGTKTKQKKKQAKVVKSPRPSISKPMPMEVEGDKRDDDEMSVPSTTISTLKQFLPHQIVDMKGNYIVGGVYHIDLVAIPPLPVTATNWILEQVEENPKLQHIKYHIDVTSPRPPKPGEKPTQAAMFAEAENRRYEDELTNAISVILKLPDFVLFLDQPQLAFWNEDHSLWVNEGFHELKYNEDNRSLSFKIVHFGVIGIAQSKYINFPYQSWELKPKEFCNNCCLSITGAQVSLVIEILGGQCCISQLQTLEDSALHAELCNEWMKARQLLKKLKNIGVYIVPDEYATSYLGNTPKERELDDSVYKTIAMFADVYLFGSSHWNTTVGPKRIVMKYSPTCGRDEEYIKNLLLVEHEKAIFLQCVEQSSSFREEPLAGSECCAVFYHLLLSGMPHNGFQRMNQTRDEYCTCIYKLLSSIKLLSY